MINIWNYVNARKVKIIDVDGNEFVGRVAAIFDKDETYDKEDSITIFANGSYIGFFPSEIKEVKELK